MASEAPLPTAFDASGRLPIWMPTAKVPVTVYGFPSYEPLRLEEWSVQHLHVPLRRDILHLAVVFEGDNTRQGTASSKTRWEVRGSHRKVHPQKGTGQARAGTRQSPLRKGGGKSFGPKPRDFGTKMNRKVYDLAWRTALSYRYRRGELTVCEDGMDLQLPAGYDKLFALSGTKEVEQGFREKWLMQILRWNEWGRSHGRVTFITEKQRPNLFSTINPMPREGRALDLADVDVKDLLETGRIVIERAALKGMIEAHQSDLVTFVFNAGVQTEKTPEIGKILVG